MKARCFRQIDELFASLLESGPNERMAILDRACAGDTELRQAVEALLAAHDRSGDFLESPALEVAAHAQAELIAGRLGRQIGPYQVRSLLGTGGMGEVYLAHDPRLDRMVALKLLPFVFTQDPGRILRFEREARAASALNHPNIVTIYEIGRTDDSHYIAAELVAGRTLRAALSAGDLTLRQKLDLVAQLAEALAAAHAAGIVHRDIKPENIMVRPDGYVKVLDFGIAKLTNAEVSSSLAEDPSNPAETGTGALVGTVAYMSPEQASGLELDHRTDIFSAGVILYEMFAGIHPFSGVSLGDTLDAIQHRDPDPPAMLDETVAPELLRILKKVLAKKRESRYQTAQALQGDLRQLQRTIEIADSSPDHAAATGENRVGFGRSRGAVALGLVALSLVAAASVYFLFVRARFRSDHPAATSSSRLTFTKLTDQPGQELFPSLSPDGDIFLYAAQTSGNWDIYRQRVGGREPLNLTSDSLADDTQPAFSPDGGQIAFRSERDRGGIYLMNQTGGSARRLTEIGYHPAWSADGREIAFSTVPNNDPNIRRPDTGNIWVVNVTTGDQRRLTDDRTGDADQPQWSPSGARIAYWGTHNGGQRDLWTISTRGGIPVPITDDAAFDLDPVWSPDGHYLYFASDRGGSMNLWRIPLDEVSGRVTGPPEPVTTPSTYAQQIAFSHDGRRAVFVNRVNRTNIFATAFNPYREAIVGAPSAITQGSQFATSPDLSPDGETFVYSSQGERREDLYLIRSDGTGTALQLTNDDYKDRNPRWSPDGSVIVFYSDRSGSYQAWSIRPDGRELRQLTFTSGAGIAYPFFSPDGLRLGYDRKAESASILELSRPWSEQTPRQLPLMGTSPPAAFWAFSWSPDGTKLGGWSNVPEVATGIEVYSFATDRYERLTKSGANPIWMKDNRRLLFSDRGALFLVNSETHRVQPLAIPILPTGQINSFGLSGDNRLLYYSVAEKEADIWLADLE